MNKKVDLYKILHITGNTAYGGTTFYSKTLILKALDEGFEVHYETNQQEVIEELNNLDVQILSIREMRRSLNPFFDLITFYKLFKYIKKENFDIVHSHTSKGGFIGRLAARIGGAKVIVHSVQGFAFHEHSGKFSTLFYSILEKFAGYFCDSIIFVNKHDLDIAIKKKIIPLTKAELIYNGVAPEKVQISREHQLEARNSIRSEFNIPHDAIIIGAIARLSPQKGISYLIQAVPDLISKYDNIWFLIVGTGEEYEHFLKIKKELKIKDRLIFAGYRTDNARLLNSFDIYILPSIWEGFSLSLLEAMAVGLPIITTSIKGNREAINEDCGILIPPKSSAAIKDAVVKYLENPLLKKLKARNALTKFMNEHTHENMLNQTYTLYKNILRKNRIQI